ncbi:hypothetical protein FHW58_002493 [Duganella sp. 1224]|uniref:DUF4148 domain-containing protein n=1 Tax=Duganella sp. 1224 TaxID=2587052 RepID=UPI0015CC288A|nr:DUF4148 domain-containing protein [Duganella sp. 1224]NYE61286.1 hypothetical protein [Duganella sp. 1224]
MKNITIALSLAATVFAAGAASAQESAEYSGYTGFVATATRAQVQAETRLAIQRGEISDGEQYPASLVERVPAAKTRAQVKAELIAYRKTHPEVSDDVSVVQ